MSSLQTELLGLSERLRRHGLHEDSERTTDICAEVIALEANLSMIREQLRIKNMNHEDLSTSAIMAIRRVLEGENVPPAAFIDDHVGNALFQRNKLMEVLTEIRHTVAHGTGFTGQENILSRIDSAFREAMIAPAGEIAHVEEAQGHP